MWIVVVHFKRVIVVCSYMVQLQLQLFPVSSGGTSRYSQKKNVDFVENKGDRQVKGKRMGQNML